MFKFVLVCALFAVAISSPIPDEVRKTANIQKTSEYYLTSESKPPMPKSSGLTRPSPINPNVQSDPKPLDSSKIIPASLTSEDTKSLDKTATKPIVGVVVPKGHSLVILTGAPTKAITSDSHVAEPTNAESAKVPAPLTSDSSVQKINKPTPYGTRTVKINNNNNRPAAHLDSNPSIASPDSSAKSSPPTIVGVEKKTVKRETSPAKHLDHDNDSTSTSPPHITSSDSNSHKHNEKPTKSSSNDDSYNRDNQPPKYVHPVPVTQIIKDSPPAEVHQHKDE